MTWYLADLVFRIDVGDDPRTVVHVNTHLVAAGAAESAHDRALRLGRSHESDDENVAGERVRTRFLGLSELVEIYEPLEDGAEIAWHERIGLSDLEAQHLVRKRRDLAVFRAPASAARPDYAPAEIVAEADALIAARLVGIDHVAITMPPGGVTEARRFYVALLGMTEIEQPGGHREPAELWLRAGDRQLLLLTETTRVARHAPVTRITYSVTKLSEWCARMAAAGIEIVECDSRARRHRVELRDPMGNEIELVERGHQR